MRRWQRNLPFTIRTSFGSLEYGPGIGAKPTKPVRTWPSVRLGKPWSLRACRVKRWMPFWYRPLLRIPRFPPRPVRFRNGWAYAAWRPLILRHLAVDFCTAYPWPMRLSGQDSFKAVWWLQPKSNPAISMFPSLRVEYSLVMEPGRRW